MEQAAPAPEVNDDELLSKLFDELDTTEAEPDDNVAVEPEAKEAPAAEVEVQKVEVPTDVPLQLKDHWDKFPEEARDKIIASYRDLNKKLADQGRVSSGIKPIHDRLVKAAKEIPGLKDLKPEDVADQVFELAKISAQFREKPVDALMGLVKQHQMEEALRQALGGQADTAKQTEQFQQKIANLERRLSEVASPDYLHQQYAQFSSQTELERAVNEFAGQAEHWGAVENQMPAAIQFAKAKLGESASAQDVLSQAYDLAVSQIVPEDQRASPSDSATDKQTDPRKTEAAKKAKSVNVTGTQTGSAREPTEDELLGKVWETSQNK